MYQRILVPIDGTDVSEGGMSEAFRIAKSLGSVVHLFHVVDLSHVTRGAEGSAALMNDLHDRVRADAARLLERAVARARDLGVQAESSSTEIMTGRPADEILGQLKHSQSDLIVMGTHGRRGFRRAVLGSDAEAVARNSTVPVLLVPSKKGR
jgi:nucleotide-binding universal stress UspA family protein